LIVAGTSFATYALAFLGRSISVMAEARRLVTGGPYSIIRHPLYLGEEVAAVGVAIQFFSGWALLLLAVHLGCQVYRMRREEGVLEETFPEYRSYMAETYRVIPGVY
jgi:protein-S-isoprenylcysteine O-methyltransferase Ste14